MDSSIWQDSKLAVGNNRERLTDSGVRYTGKTNTLPTEISPLDGVLLRFDELDPTLATDLKIILWLKGLQTHLPVWVCSIQI